MLTPSSSPSREGEPYLPPNVVDDVQVRLSRLAGHVRAVGRMLAGRRDCLEVLIQLVAVRAALTQVSLRLLEAHADTCLRMIETPQGQQPAAERLREALTGALGDKS